MKASSSYVLNLVSYPLLICYETKVMLMSFWHTHTHTRAYFLSNQFEFTLTQSYNMLRDVNWHISANINTKVWHVMDSCHQVTTFVTKKIKWFFYVLNLSYDSFGCLYFIHLRTNTKYQWNESFTFPGVDKWPMTNDQWWLTIMYR